MIPYLVFLLKVQPSVIYGSKLGICESHSASTGSPTKVPREICKFSCGFSMVPLVHTKAVRVFLNFE